MILQLHKNDRSNCQIAFCKSSPEQHKIVRCNRFLEYALLSYSNIAYFGQKVAKKLQKEDALVEA